MGKTVLILGNGFDFAHGLPTRYSDFIEFSNRLLAIYILKRFLANDATRIHIVARDKASGGELISNLIRIAGEDVVIEKAISKKPPMLEFW